MSNSDLLHGLNAPQRLAVNTAAGPLLVLAGAGTGKTRVVTYRIARLIARGTPPQRILAVTFTNKAANEMRDRITALLGKRTPSTPEISTFHSLCVRILKRHAERLGYRPGFIIYATGQQDSLARQVLREVKLSGAALKPGELLQMMGRWKSRGMSPAQAAGVAETDKEHLAAAAFRRYQRALKRANAVDFDDLLLLAEKLFAQFPDARRDESSRFDHVLVDEYQDTNGSQYRIIRALAAPHRNLCVVGDDDQSIYGWRGAEVEHILRFVQDWPGARVIRLEDNYRSTAAILEYSNRLIRFNQRRHDKQLKAARPNGEKPALRTFANELEEAQGVVADIRDRLAQDGFQPRDFAILFRTNEQPRAFEAELRREKLPYVLIGGMSFFDRREVRDALAFLQVLDDPQDEASLLRIINTPPRGIGDRTVELLLEAAAARGSSLWVLLQSPPTMGIAVATRDAIDRFVRLVNHYRPRFQRESPPELFQQWLQEVGYREELQRLYPEAQACEARWNAVGQVVNELTTYFASRKGQPSLGDFLNHTVLKEFDDSDSEKQAQLRRNAIVLMTLHAAKGLEFSQVYMVGMEEGLLPHVRSVLSDADAIEEERRLCYVGMTRAQDRLHFSLAKTRLKWGKPRPTFPSRFLFELMDQADKAAAVAQSSVQSLRRPVSRA